MYDTVFSASTVGIQTEDGGRLQDCTAGGGKTKQKQSSSRKHVALSVQPLEKFVLLLRMPFHYAVSRESPSSIILRLLLGFPQPSEERGDGLEGHTFPVLLGRVFARLPLIKSVLWDDILIIQTVEEHPEKICKRAETLLSTLIPSHIFPPYLWSTHALQKYFMQNTFSLYVKAAV